MKYLNETGLARLWEHISNGLDAKANLTHTHETDDIEYFREDVTSIVASTQISSLKTADSSLTLTDNNIKYDLDNVGTGVLALDRDIANKVDKVTGKGLSTNDYTTAEKNKLATVTNGAEPNVQPNWDETDTTSDAYIKNKPVIPDGAVIYHNLGQNTDGAVDQKVTTDNLNAKEALTNKVTSWSTTTTDTHYPSEKLVKSSLDGKQSTLVSGTNIKTVNNNSLVGSGNVSVGTYSKPSGGIPKSDLTSSVQTSLGLADTALQSHQDISGKENISNKVSSWSTTTTDTHYPSEKLVKSSLDNKVDKVSGKVLSTNDFTNMDKTKLDSVEVGAQVNVQADWAQSVPRADGFIKNKPNLATVATSGSYDDLSDKPTIPPAITIDTAISSTSTNPVQNKVINTALNGKVPTTRKVNGKALSSDITLGSADILVAGDRTIDDAFSSVNTSISNLGTSKQDALVSGTNIKTINNESLLGSGNITIQGGGDPSAITDARIEEICDLGGGFALTVQASYLPYQFTIYYIDNTSETFNNISDLNGTHENVVAFHGENYLGVIFDKTYTFDIYDELSEQTTSGTSNNYSFRGVKRIIMSEDMSITNMVDED